MIKWAPVFASVLHSSNQLLQALPPAEFVLLRPHLQIDELVREAVLVEAGAPLTHVYLPQSGVICMRNTLLEGQTAEVAMVGPDSVFGASAGLADDVPLTDAVVRLPGIASIPDVAGFRTAADRSATSPNAAGAASTGAVRASPAIRRVQCVAFGRSVANRAGCCMRAIEPAAKACR